MTDIAAAQLDRVLSFFERTDSKITGLFAVDAGVLAISGLNVHLDDLNECKVMVALGLSSAMLVASLFQLYIAYSPHLSGGSRSSLVYFRDIGSLSENDYIQKVRAQNDSERMDDLLSQVWRNSEILTIKFRKLKWAFRFTALSLIPWLTFLTLVSIRHSQMPRLLS